jgi:hypothetical protein
MKEIIFDAERDGNNTSILLDILSYFIISGNERTDIVFSKTNRYSISSIMSFLEKNLEKKNITKFKSILKDLKTISHANYEHLHKMIPKLKKIKYSIDVVHEDKFVKLTLNINDKTYAKYINRDTIYVKNSIYQSLLKNYNIVNHQNHESKDILDEHFIDRVYVLYTRYYTFSNGNNQSSIMPAFKRNIKKYLNIKMELFGSAINTSNRYCSLFYDIEKFFGSMGNFFDIDIQRGYFEVNPPYEDDVMNNVFIKISDSLKKAEKTKEPLLFLFIIPKRDLDKFSGYKKIEPYVTYVTTIKKQHFPFIRYDRYLAKTVVSPIVDVIVILAHNDYISDIYKSMSKKIGSKLIKWVKN